MRVGTNLIQIKVNRRKMSLLVQIRLGAQATRNLPMLTDTDFVRATEIDTELLSFDVSDDALERAAFIVGGQATPVTLVYGTSIVGNCACPV